MTYFFGIIQFILILYITLFEFKNKSSSVFLWSTLLLMFGIMNLITCVSGDSVYNDDVLIKSSIFVILFCITYLIVRSEFGKNIIKSNKEIMKYNQIKDNIQKSKKIDSILVLVLIIFVIIKLIPLVKYSGSVLNTSWGYGREYSSSLSYANSNQICNIIIYSLAGLTAIYFLQNKKKLGVFTILIFLLEVIITRNRIEILPVLCSLIAIFIFKNDSINKKAIISGILSVILVIYIIYGLRVFRHYGTISNFIANFNFFEFTGKITDHIKTGNGELGLLRDFYYFVSKGNNFPGFGQLASYVRMILVYLPTQWSFGLKPNDFAITMGSAIGMAAGGSTHPTLFGDCFANLGYFGFLLGAFWAIYVNIADKIIIKCKAFSTKILIFVLNAVVFVIIGRGSIYNGFWFIAYGVPLIIIIRFLLSKIIIKKSNIVEVTNY